ncbi:MAG TPA: dockerin type I repeat-containing protein, partial [Acetivibrio sp.]|nr:dockerin type I repeat-containing protein [Acetivibrio sp.]
AIIEPTLWKKGLDHVIPLGGITPGTFKYGDVDGDLEIDSLDLSILKRYVLRKINEFPSPNGSKAADVDGDGEINSFDVSLMKRYLLRIIKTFPVEESEQ